MGKRKGERVLKRKKGKKRSEREKQNRDIETDRLREKELDKITKNEEAEQQQQNKRS